MVALMPYYLWRHEALLLLLQEFQVCTYTAVVVSVLWSVRPAWSFMSILQWGAWTQGHKMESEAVPLLHFSFWYLNLHCFIISSFHFPVERPRLQQAYGNIVFEKHLCWWFQCNVFSFFVYSWTRSIWAISQMTLFLRLFLSVIFFYLPIASIRCEKLRISQLFSRPYSFSVQIRNFALWRFGKSSVRSPLSLSGDSCINLCFLTVFLCVSHHSASHVCSF